MTSSDSHSSRKVEQFSPGLFFLTVALSLAGLFSVVRFAAPGVWHLQLRATWWEFAVAALAISLFNCFVEYFFHRYVLHRPAIPGLGRLYRQHTLHHALTRIGRRPSRDGRGFLCVENKFPIVEPEQGEGSFFPWYSMLAFALVLAPVLTALEWLAPAFPWFVAGFAALACSLTLYETLHAINHWRFEKWAPLVDHPRWAWFWRPVYSFHLRHHAVIDCNESISGFFGLPVGDWVFRTCVIPPTIYADGEEWQAENFVKPRGAALIRWLDRVALRSVTAQRTQAAGDSAAPRTYTRGEEIANWLTHGVGAVLSVAALTLLIVFSSLRGDAWYLVSLTVFGLTLLLVYVTSAFNHLPINSRSRWFFGRMNRAAIFLLIAGTYTPFLLTSLRGAWGWSLFGVIWGLCTAGAVFAFAWGARRRMVTVLGYLFAAWIIVVALKPMLASVPAPSLWLLLAGGLCYLVGVPFYLWHRLRYHHAFWHSFVLGGSTCHFLAMLFLLRG